MKTNTAKRETALEAYDRLQADITAELETLKAQLAQHDRDFRETNGGRSWGLVGDLEHIRSLLARATGSEIV